MATALRPARAVRVHFDDGDTVTTTINGTADEIRRYYIGQSFEFDETKPMHTGKRVEFIDGGLVRVADLVGRNVDGLLADVRHFVDGKSKYAQCDSPHLARLKRVYRHKRSAEELRRGIGDEDWLYLEWHDGMYHICGCTHSGCCGSKSNETWQIKIVDESEGGAL